METVEQPTTLKDLRDTRGTSITPHDVAGVVDADPVSPRKGAVVLVRSPKSYNRKL